MARLILSILLVTLALVLLVLGYLQFADLNKYNDALEAKVAEATGRAFTLEKIDLEVFPDLRFSAEGVSLASPDWGSEPQMLQIGKLLVTLRSASLFSGSPVIENITLEDVVLLLETDASGDLNWGIDQAAAGAAGASPEVSEQPASTDSMPLKLEHADIRRVLVKRRQPGSPEQQLAIDLLSINPGSAGTMDLAGSGTVDTLVFDLAARLALSRESIAIDPLRLRVGSSDIIGSISLISGEVDSIRADLRSKRLDLTEFPGGERAGPASGEHSPTAPVESGEGKGKYVFVDDPLPLEQLLQRDMEVRLAIAEFVSPAAMLEKLSVAGTLRDGELNADVEFATPVGARSASRILLKAEGDRAQLQASVNARDLRLNIASGKGAEPTDIPPISLSLKVDSTGGSPRALAAGSEGEVLVTIGQGRIDNKLVGALSGDILAQLSAALNPFASKDPYTTFECGVLHFNIEQGVATLDPMVLQGEKVTIVADGTLDLNTEKLDIKFNTQPREGLGVSADMFVTPFVALRGTLAKPTVGANKTGALVAAGTGGLSLVVRGARDRLGGTRDHCRETLPSYSHPPLAGD